VVLCRRQVTQRRKVGCVGGNAAYGIKTTEMVPIKPAKAASTQSWGKQVGVGTGRVYLGVSMREKLA
jgi:hypothetical protein